MNIETISELLIRLALYKSREKVYEVGQIANKMGRFVIRLHFYHCQYNPIELTWVAVKREVAQINKTSVL
jgi:hypothetical protein